MKDSIFGNKISFDCDVADNWREIRVGDVVRLSGSVVPSNEASSLALKIPTPDKKSFAQFAMNVGSMRIANDASGGLRGRLRNWLPTFIPNEGNSDVTSEVEPDEEKN